MDTLAILISLLGGLALFLYGLSVMTGGLKTLAGSNLKPFLEKMTSNRWSSMLAGAGITAVIQSTSLTTVLVVGFVSAGILSFANSLGIILGAGIGATLIAQLLAFKITNAALAIFAFGFFISVLQKRKLYREIGTVLLGLGLLFFGMNLIGEGTAPLKDYPPFLEWIGMMANPLWGVLFGILFTALVQSSLATIGVAMLLVSNGLIGMEMAMALMIGANAGTSVTAILSALGKPRVAMQVAMAHVVFKVSGSLLWFFLIPLLIHLAAFFSPHELHRQVADAYMIFNVANAFLFIGFTTPLAKLVKRIVPDEVKQEDVWFPNLDNYYLDHSGTALEMVRSALQKLSLRVLMIVEKGFPIALDGNDEELMKLRSRDRRVDEGHTQILKFIQKIQGNNLSEKDAQRLRGQIEVANLFETIADLITTDLVEAAEHRVEKQFAVSDETRRQLSELYSLSIEALKQASCQPFLPSKSRTLLNGKHEFREKYLNIRMRLVDRLSDSDPNRIDIFRFETEMLEIARRMYALSRRLSHKEV